MINMFFFDHSQVSTSIGSIEYRKSTHVIRYSQQINHKSGMVPIGLLRKFNWCALSMFWYTEASSLWNISKIMECLMTFNITQCHVMVWHGNITNIDLAGGGFNHRFSLPLLKEKLWNTDPKGCSDFSWEHETDTNHSEYDWGKPAANSIQKALGFPLW